MKIEQILTLTEKDYEDIVTEIINECMAGPNKFSMSFGELVLEFSYDATACSTEEYGTVGERIEVFHYFYEISFSDYSVLNQKGEPQNCIIKVDEDKIRKMLNSDYDFRV